MPGCVLAVVGQVAGYSWMVAKERADTSTGEAIVVRAHTLPSLPYTQCAGLALAQCRVVCVCGMCVLRAHVCRLCVARV